jgi:O-antigen/teichoic acid export membrane protein
MRFKLPPFWRNVLTVMTGTVAAQAIPLGFLPVLTRIVPAAELGIFFLWIGTAGVTTLLIGASLNKAIFSADREEDIPGILQLSLVVGLIIALSIPIVIWSLNLFGFSPLKGDINRYVIGLTIYSLIMAFNYNLQAIFIYRSQFGALNKAKCLLSISVALAQIVTVSVIPSAPGLIYSTVTMSGLSTVVTMYWLKLSWIDIASGISLYKLRNAFSANYRFLVFSFPSDLISTISAQLPLLIIGVKFGAVPAAAYALVLRVVSIPIGFLSSSILTVFKDRAGQDYRKHGNCSSVYIKTLKVLSLLSVIPFVFIYLSGEYLVELIFGKQWILAGQYLQTLAPVYFFAFIASPLSYVFYFAKQSVDLVCQCFSALVIYFVFSHAHNMTDAITHYAIFGSIYYLIYLLLSYRASLGVK